MLRAGCLITINQVGKGEEEDHKERFYCQGDDNPVTMPWWVVARGYSKRTSNLQFGIGDSFVYLIPDEPEKFDQDDRTCRCQGDDENMTQHSGPSSVTRVDKRTSACKITTL